jgi:hypothetical protein
MQGIRHDSNGPCRATQGVDMMKSRGGGTMKGGWMIMMAALALGACQPDSAERHDVSGEAVPARTGPMRPPEAHMEGQYVLVTAHDATLPAVLEHDPPCRTEILDAALRIDAGRFTFQNRVRQACDPVPPGPPAEPVVHAAGGRVTLDGNAVVLIADVGQAFSEAHGRADETGITIDRLMTDEGGVIVAWRFERGGPQLVPVPGTEDRATGPDNP